MQGEDNEQPADSLADQISPASRRAVDQILAAHADPYTREAIGLLRKVQIAYGRGSWPNIDAFLDGLDAPTNDNGRG